MLKDFENDPQIVALSQEYFFGWLMSKYGAEFYKSEQGKAYSWKDCIIDIKRKLKQSKVLAENKATHHTLIWEQTWKCEGNTHDYWEREE